MMIESGIKLEGPLLALSWLKIEQSPVHVTEVPAKLKQFAFAMERQQTQSTSIISSNMWRRIGRTCKYCRRLKEKCMSVTPCIRCRRLRRPPRFGDKMGRASVSGKYRTRSGSASSATIFPDYISMDFEAERIQALEYIVRYYTGLERCDRLALESIISGISLNLIVPPKMDKDGEEDENRRADKALTNLSTTQVSGTDITVNKRGSDPQLSSQETSILEAVSLFPAASSALVLLRVFFEIGQTNYFYIDEESLRQRLDQFYSCSSQISPEDASWISVALMVFALGVQLSSHYQSTTRDSCRELMRDARDICQSMDDSIDSIFYQRAKKLIPDILLVESTESVQAFLLFGLYMLPVNPVGLSYTYFGIAIKLATQLNLHMNTTSAVFSKEFETVGIMRNKLTFPRRTSALHGRPVSVPRADINADSPVDMEELQPKERINTFQNTMAMLKLSIFMENAWEGVLDKQRQNAWLKLQAHLVDGCVDSAVAIVNLCQMLHNEKSLSKSLYMELSSCYTAVLVLVASCAYDKDDRLKDACEKGVEILQEMSTGFSSTGFKSHVAESLKVAFERTSHGRKGSARSLDEDGYKQFQNWVALQEITTQEGFRLPK
ncbi:unnamed protein product [Fusarium venenatum]|uniref:Xylanolytic transcriptional activator regulatory domain-containing protein n=1 Tax=Fusarium venenatum TaxID=56646 RepID=A0A2L2TYE9_9HYPO|nr:uncharacterized protein FVRRES_10013 [Fusarium venenatum]CEI69936.1 unnamed protein product [Fusarium venenatum]